MGEYKGILEIDRKRGVIWFEGIREACRAKIEGRFKFDHEALAQEGCIKTDSTKHQYVMAESKSGCPTFIPDGLPDDPQTNLQS